MRFWLLDKIDSYEPGVCLTATKNVALAEEYLADHFPEFPVLPGVFMLEAATQSASWLLRLSEDFAHSVILLKEVKNVKYADFVSPGSSLRVEVTTVKMEDRLATFKVKGRVWYQTTLSGRLVLERYNLSENDATLAEIDHQIIERFRLAKNVLLPPSAAAATA